MGKSLINEFSFSSNYLTSFISKLIENLRKTKYNDGSTAAIVLRNENKIITSHLGDSRVVVIRDNGSIHFQTNDHKPSNRSEFERIRDDGSRVVLGRTQGILGVSRSIGDFNVLGISSEPTINEVYLDSSDKWLVIGCDGVFDVIYDELLGKIANNSSNSLEFAYNLRNISYSLLSRDNISVIVVDLQYKPNIDEIINLPQDFLFYDEDTPFPYSRNLFHSRKTLIHRKNSRSAK